MKKVSFHTLGCKLNYAETASLEQQFVDRGYTVVPFTEHSDVCVVNTCSVTERADRECRQLVRRALRTSPNAFVAVVGCYAQLQPEEIASIDGVDVVLGAGEKFHLFSYTEDFQKFDAAKIFVAPINNASDFGPASSGGVGDRTRAFLKVQDGCDFNCSFCTIPLARGKSRSQSIGDCVLQAKHLVDGGYREIVLTGVNVGDYGRQDGGSLIELLRRLEAVEGLERIRVSSIEPNLLTPALLDFWIESKKVCNHFHLPLQSGSDEILRKMRRRYTTAEYRDLVHAITEKCFDAGIGVDIIVGFPGETETLFKKSYEFVHELPVSYLHVFTYSERPNTPSLELPGRVEPRVRYKRSAMLRNLGGQKKQAFYRSQMGLSRPVLLERSVENDVISGYTDNYVRVRVPYRPSLENEIVQVRLCGRSAEGCLGVVEDIERPAARVPVTLPALQAVMQ
jgi:threonylcarbamoyladenosine tRNA methylthiotransferase MtaB